jgi:transcriptional activator for dhaKLM operon
MAQLNAIVEASANGLLVLDERGVLMHINETATRIIGLPRQAVLGRKIGDVVQYPDFLNEAVSHRDPLTDVEITLQFGQRQINCVISVNYVLKDGVVRWVIATIRQEQDVRELIHQQVGAQAPMTLEDIPGASASIRRVQRFVKVAAPAQASILIRGETGTGKNVLASAIHNASPRREGPFLIVGCTSIPHEWVVSELLGYDENLDRKNPGGRPSKFELAHGGTLFFQSIDDLPLEAQAILLNALDLGIVQRLGSDRPIEVNVRVIASTSANIEKLIAQGNFRADLYYRLSSFEIILPPLRERMEDIPVLVTRILARISRQLGRNFLLETGVIELLSQYTWPGNVRELEAVLGRAAVQSGPTGSIGPLLLPVHIQNPGDHLHTKRPPEVQSLYQLERESILQAAQVCKGNVSEMAKLLGIGRTTVWRRLKEMNIELEEYRYRSEV